MKIEILKWDKYNPRKDIKTTSWLRLQNDFCHDPDFYGFSCEEKMVWIYILCSASKKYSPKIKICEKQICAALNISTAFVRSSISKLKSKEIQCIKVLTSRGRHVDVTCTAVVKSFALPTNETQHKEHNIYSSKIESIYNNFYPRKEGKSKGVSIILKQIENDADIDRFEKAVKNYAKENNGNDKKFIKIFSTFCNKDIWVDYIDFKPRWSIENETF